MRSRGSWRTGGWIGFTADVGSSRTTARGGRLWWLTAGLVVGMQMVGVDAAALPEGAAAASEPVQRLAAEVRGLGWICFGARSEVGDWDLFVMRPDGSERRNLTATPDFNEFAPQFSRDGLKLLYRRMPRSESVDGNHYGEQGQLMVTSGDARQPEALGEAGAFPWAAWSPDGRQVARLALRGIGVVDVG